MFFKKLDCLSPKITLYFFNQKSHSNILGGILTLITYFCYIITLAYFSLDIIIHDNATSFFYNRIIEDAGIFSFNDSMFHFINILAIIPESSIIQIIGIENNEIVNYSVNGKREKFNHYIYNLCTKDMKKYIKKEIREQIDDSIYYHYSYCIESFYNSTTGKISKYNQNNFTYPSIAHGMSNLDRTYYGIIIQKCINSSLNNNSCDTPENIEKKIYSIHFDFRLINYDVDIKNYKNPIISSFISIGSGFSSSSLIVNNVNLRPLKILSHGGLIFNSINEKTAYNFEQNEKQTYDSVYGILCSYYFWMQNNAIIYERNYKKIQNIFSNFGGMTQTIYMFFSFINWIFYKFTMLNDINKLLCNMIYFKKDKNFSYNYNLDCIPNSNSILNLKINHSNSSKRIIHSLKLINDNKNRNILNNIDKSFNNNIIFDIKKYIFFRNINFCPFLKWIISCKTKNSNQSEKLSYIYNMYKNIISEESFFYINFIIKEVEKTKNYNNISKNIKN